MGDAGYVLGVSSHFHDAAAALLHGDTIIAAAQEERFSRQKADWRFPEKAIAYCLSHLPHPQPDLKIAYYENPALKLDRVLASAHRTAPRGAANWPRTLRMLRDYGHGLPADLQKLCQNASNILCVPHHRSHAAAAFYPSPFDEAAVLVVDGVGEWSTTSLWLGRGRSLEPIREIGFPNSLGLFYSAFTQYCGFRVNSGEYKLMGLAPFGQPCFRDRILDNLIRLHDDGSFALNMPYFRFDTEPSTISPLFEELFGQPTRHPEDALTQHYMDVAASAQAVLQDALAGLASAALRLTGQDKLCLAGGVALNCVANTQLATHLPGLCSLWVQPAAGDAGGALGAALDVAAHQTAEGSKPGGTMASDMQGSLLGPDYAPEACCRALDAAGLVYEQPEDLPTVAAGLLAQGKILGHFDGRMEFGPRALGNRSILADPRDADMLSRVNRMIKFREGWRPFAPMVLKDQVAQCFDGPDDSPFMLFVAHLKETFRKDPDLSAARANGAYMPQDLIEMVGSAFPAVTHVDYSARLQTVDPTRQPSQAARILEAFHEQTGCPMLLNTSLNVRGEPIVCSPADAVACFMNTHMDALVLGPYLVQREAQGDAMAQKIGRMRFAAD